MVERTKIIIMFIMMVVTTFAAVISVSYFINSSKDSDEVVWLDKEDLRAPKVPIGVVAFEFEEATIAAMIMWNDVADCKLFELGTDVIVKSSDGDVCGASILEMKELGNRDTHSAGSYQCKIERGWEIIIYYPGDLGQQFYIMAHELGHILGLADDGESSKRVMNQYKIYSPVLPSDKDLNAINKKYCRK